VITAFTAPALSYTRLDVSVPGRSKIIRSMTTSLVALTLGAAPGLAAAPPIVLTQVPDAPVAGPWETGILRADYGRGGRIVLVRDGTVERVLT